MKPSDVSPLGFGVRARHLEPTPLVAHCLGSFWAVILG